MNDTPQDAWFYSGEGERIGPVTLSDLRIKATDGELNPRLDMVWTQGMDAWKPSGEIEGLFERRTAPEPAQTLGPPTDPYSPPKQETAAEVMGKEGGWPGARRRSYLLITLFFPGLWVYGVAAAMPFLTSQFGPQIMIFASPGIRLIPALVFIFIGLRRLVNLGMSRWWFLGNFVPILGFWVGYRCFACPGGFAYHKKLDGAGIFLAIVYWLLLAIGLVVMGLLIAILLGAFGSPELRDQIREIMRHAANGSPPKP
ncbi:MAG: GYF domain-containing protein [Luteolibacter sp.]|uniref:GYF domain-containing protein n=1 Tax=Luteolibacter sp. TaxID=1962973 RepID=UPI003266BE66